MTGTLFFLYLVGRVIYSRSYRKGVMDMITLYYERSGVEDTRIFRSRMELLDWIIRQSKIEKFTVLKIEEAQL